MRPHGGLLANVPSIKATGFQSAADDLGKLVAAGRISRQDMERRLHPSDLPFLGKQLAASSWVPIETYVRVLDILVELEAGGDVEGYLRERGRRAGARLHKLGIYSQFNASVETYGERVGNVTTSMTAVLYNFSRWSYVPIEPYEFQLVVEDATHYPEYLRFVAEGFTEYLGEALPGGAKMAISSERVTRDKIVFKGKLRR
ncbi:MAG TPA: hypothetical protein VMR31_07150 [Myxococcota bacterium]|nr:hypothetical protein [Myxococcota bacterium]